MVAQPITTYTIFGGLPHRRGEVDVPTDTNIIPSLIAGSAPVGSTQYPIPTSGSVLYVDPVAGNNANPGTVSSPLKTCESAIAKIGVNGTIVLRGGIYHEGKVGTASVYGGISVTTAGVTIQNYPNEAVWFDGSSIVTGWTLDTGIYRHDGWTLALDRSPTFSFGAPDGTGSPWQFVNPLYPTAAWPEMLFVDGVQYTQVNSKAGVTAGSTKFFIDQAADQVFMGTNPAGHQVRISDLQVTLVGLATGVTFRGIGFRRYAPSMPHLGAIKMLRASNKMENCWFEDISGAAVSFQSGGDIKVTNVSVFRAGNMGIHCNNADRISFSRIRIQYANTRFFNMSPASGGLKATRLVGLTLKESVFYDCYTHSVWCDESVANANMFTCDVQRGDGFGIVMEIGGNTVIANMLVTDTGQSGIKVINSDQLQLWNCTIHNSCSVSPDRWGASHGNGRPVDITEDTRAPMTSTSVGLDTRYPFPRTDVGMDWVMTVCVVKNNIMSRAPNALAMIAIEDYNRNNGTGRDYTAFGPSWDGNFYNRIDTTHPSWFSILNKPGASSPSIYTSLSAMRAATALDPHSLSIENTDAMNPDHTIKSAYAAQAQATAQPLPTAIANLIGKPTGTLHVGCWR